MSSSGPASTREVARLTIVVRLLAKFVSGGTEKLIDAPLLVLVRTLTPPALPATAMSSLVSLVKLPTVRAVGERTPVGATGGLAAAFPASPTVTTMGLLKPPF